MVFRRLWEVKARIRFVFFFQILSPMKWQESCGGSSENVLSLVPQTADGEVSQCRIKLSCVLEIWLVGNKIDRQIPRADRDVKITV